MHVKKGVFVPVFVRLGDFDLLMFLVPVNKDRVEFHEFYYFNTVIIITFSFLKGQTSTCYLFIVIWFLELFLGSYTIHTITVFKVNWLKFGNLTSKFSRRDGTWKWKLHWYPKFYNHGLWFVSLKTFITLIISYLVGQIFNK